MTFPAPIHQTDDEKGFLACPACYNDEFVVVCSGVPLEPRVTALVCSQCEVEIPVAAGLPFAPQIGRA
jgi:hypothetical protein